MYGYWTRNRIFSIGLHLWDEKGNFQGCAFSTANSCNSAFLIQSIAYQKLEIERVVGFQALCATVVDGPHAFDQTITPMTMAYQHDAEENFYTQYGFSPLDAKAPLGDGGR